MTESLKADEGFTITSTTQNAEQLAAQFNKTPETPAQAQEKADSAPVEAKPDPEASDPAKTAPEGESKPAERPKDRHKNPQARVEDATRQAAEERRAREAEKKRADELEAKYLANQAELERLKAGKPAETKPEPTQAAHANDGRPKQEDFDDWDKYQEALVDWKIEQRDAKARQEQERNLAIRHQAETYRGFEQRIKERVEAGRDDNITAEALELVPRGPIDFSKRLSNDEVIGWQIVSEKSGIDLLKHLSDNPNELQRLRGLGQGALLIELGRLDGRLSSATTATEPKPIQISRANPPVRPVTAVPPSGEDELDGSEPFEVYAKKRMRQMERERKAQLG